MVGRVTATLLFHLRLHLKTPLHHRLLFALRVLVDTSIFPIAISTETLSSWGKGVRCGNFLHVQQQTNAGIQATASGFHVCCNVTIRYLGNFNNFHWDGPT
jgi:hypothetical protein